MTDVTLAPSPETLGIVRCAIARLSESDLCAVFGILSLAVLRQPSNAPMMSGTRVAAALRLGHNNLLPTNAALGFIGAAPGLDRNSADQDFAARVQHNLTRLDIAGEIHTNARTALLSTARALPVGPLCRVFALVARRLNREHRRRENPTFTCTCQPAAILAIRKLPSLYGLEAEARQAVNAGQFVWFLRRLIYERGRT